MDNIHIENSYNTWRISGMREAIDSRLNNESPRTALNRNYPGMYIEWGLHNVGYYATKPFCRSEKIRKINLRCKDVDLQRR